MVIVWWSASGLVNPSFLNPSKTITSESSSVNQWDAQKTATPTARTGQQKGPSSPQQCPSTHHTSRLQKLNKLGCEVLPHPPYSPDLSPTTTSSISWQLFAGKMLPQPEVVRKYFPRVPLILKHRFLCCRNKLPLIFLFGKNVLNVMVPILVNKDVFEPSYDWKFTVQNWNYFFANLINEYINAQNRQITHAEQFHTTYVDSQSLRR